MALFPTAPGALSECSDEGPLCFEGDSVRVMMFWIAVHLAALAVGAWAVLSHEAAAWLLAPSLALAVAAMAARMDGEP